MRPAPNTTSPTRWQEGSSDYFRRVPPSDAAIEQSLAERTSRTIGLHDVITQIVLRQPDAATADLRAKLAAAVARLGPWTDASIDWTSEQFMASHAQRLASKDNYEPITETDADGKVTQGMVVSLARGPGALVARADLRPRRREHRLHPFAGAAHGHG